MAQPKEITLQDLEAAFNAGKSKHTVNRGGGRIDSTDTYKDADTYLLKLKGRNKEVKAYIKEKEEKSS